MKKKAFVTGATGCVGRNLVDELIKEGWEVIAAHRKSSDVSRLKGLDLRLAEVDLHDSASVLASLPDGIDAIFHVAGNTSHWSAEIDQQWKDNVLATRNLVNAALSKKVKRFIFTSTGATWSWQGGDEKNAETIDVPYIRTKRLAELEVERGIALGLDAVFLHPIIVVGAYDYNSYSQIFAYLGAARAKFAFPGRIAFCHARDVAIAHVRAFESGRTDEHYMLGGDYASWQDFFRKIVARIGAAGEVRIAKRWQLMLVGYLSNLLAAITRKKPTMTPALVKLLKDAPDIPSFEKRKASEQIAYRSRSLDAMVEDCYQWMLAEGRITAPAVAQSAVLTP